MKNLTIEELAKVNGGYKSITYIGIDEEGTEVDLVKAGIGITEEGVGYTSMRTAPRRTY